MADLDRIQKFYIAYYGRAADTVGLDYWNGVLTANPDESNMVKNFGSSEQPEYQDLFGTNAIADFIQLVYQNLFNRVVETDGLNYWLGVYNAEILKGTDPNLIRANMVTYIMDGAQGDDATSVANKLTVANAFTAAVDTTDEITAYSDVNNTTGYSEVRALLQTVDSDPASVTAATAMVDTTMDAVVAGYTGNTGVTLGLTIGEDVLNGSEANDAFNAPVVQDNNAGVANTLESFDILDGKGGTDTLNATINTVAGNVAPVLMGIENVNLRFTANETVDLTNSTGVTTLKVANSTDTGTVIGVGSTANLAVANQLQNVNFNGSTAATLGLNLDTLGNTTTPTQVLVNLQNQKATTLNITANDAANAQVVGAGVTKTLTVAATGTNKLDLNEAFNATSVTVTGKGSADLTNNGAAFNGGGLTTFDASANSGGVKADIQSGKAAVVTAGTGADTIDMDTTVTAGTSVALGGGDDKLFTGANLAMFDKGADGGEGTDIINITDGSKLDATTSKYISNFETLDVSGGTGNYDVSLNEFATVQIDEAINGALAGPVDFKNAPDTFTLDVASKAKTNGDFAVGQTIAVTGKDYTGTTAKGTAETFTLVAMMHDGNKDDTADGNIDANTVTVAGVENLVVEANTATLDGGTKALKASAHTLTASIVATEAETLTVKGDASVDLSGVSDIGVVTKVDASGSTGNVTVNLSKQGNSVAYSGSDGVDTYTASVSGDTIYTDMGADVVTLGAVRDIFVLKAATDSQVTDTSKDGKITLGADTGWDVINGFVTGGAGAADRIDLTNLSFSGAQRGVADVTAKVSATTDLTSVVDLFDSVAGDRGVAFSTVAGTAVVFVDYNKDGDFTAADDIVIQLTGGPTIAEVDINF